MEPTPHQILYGAGTRLVNFSATKRPVGNRGNPPEAFLAELVTWGKAAPEDIFAKNDNRADIYAAVYGNLGPFVGILCRRAVMLEVMRVHAGLESSWNWNEGVDRGNARSQRDRRAEETGIFQVSFDSEALSHAAMLPFAVAHDIVTPETFIPAMKSNHALALEYYARLVRISIGWAGPLISGKINPFLSRAAVTEFMMLLATEVSA